MDRRSIEKRCATASTEQSPVGRSSRKTSQTCAGIRDDEFLEAHYAANRPVVLIGEMPGWPALERWTPGYLKHLVGSAEVEVQAGRVADADFERNMAAHARRLPFDSFIDQILRPDAGNDTYLTAYNSASNVTSLAVLERDLGFLDKILDRHVAQPHGMLWIGRRAPSRRCTTT